MQDGTYKLQSEIPTVVDSILLLKTLGFLHCFGLLSLAN